MPEHCSTEIPERCDVMAIEIIVALCNLKLFIFSGIINQTKHSRWNITRDHNNSVSLYQSALSLSIKPPAKYTLQLPSFHRHTDTFLSFEEDFKLEKKNKIKKMYFLFSVFFILFFIFNILIIFLIYIKL